FIALIAFLIGQESVGDMTLAMPDWWPLIKPHAPPAPNTSYVYVLFPVIAALGYGDIAITRVPRVKARRTAGLLLGYSLVLMALALAGSVGAGTAGDAGDVAGTGVAGSAGAAATVGAAAFA